MILYGTDPVVVEYDPGTDIVIEKFSFLPVSDDFSRATRILYPPILRGDEFLQRKDRKL